MIKVRRVLTVQHGQIFLRLKGQKRDHIHFLVLSFFSVFDILFDVLFAR